MAAEQIQIGLDPSERCVCRVLDQPRSSQRRKAVVRSDEEAVTNQIVSLARQYGHYEHRRVTAIELFNGEIFDTILEAKVVTEAWRKQYLPAGQAGNTIRPHSSLGYRAPEAYTLRQVANT